MYQKPKLYCFTKYSEKGPSSRYRTFQYLPFWSQFYEVKVNCLLNDWYFNKKINLLGKAMYFIKSFYARIKILQEIGIKDMIWIEYELFPYASAFAERKLYKKRIPFILDYDDAIFHWYGNHKLLPIRFFFGKKIQNIISMASAVVTGSPYLTSYIKAYNENTMEIPTSVNIPDYHPNGATFEIKPANCLIIGWLGSKTTSVNLAHIKDAFVEFIKESSAELWLMGYDKNQEALWQGLPVKFFPWSAEAEKDFLRTIDVGIMPLFKNDFNKGKCGFKLIQYMAMGKPTISTPLDANKKIDRASVNFFAESKEDWMSCFKIVHESISKTNYGVNREVVIQYYNASINEAAYRGLFVKILKTKNTAIA